MDDDTRRLNRLRILAILRKQRTLERLLRTTNLWRQAVSSTTRTK